MDTTELETYQVQLSQVELALETDGANAGLLSLRSELQELISLTQQTLAQTSSTSRGESTRKAGQVAASHAWAAAGNECLAKYSGDGNWYAARITSVGGSGENPVYSIMFKGYNTTELVKGTEMKALPASYQEKGPGPSKRKSSKAEDEERDRKKKRNEKKVEAKAAKAKEQLAKQATWQKFARKSEKKGVHIAGVAGTSIFKTPDNPLGRVGVTGSGKGMTEVASRGKHKFAGTDDAGAGAGASASSDARM